MPFPLPKPQKMVQAFSRHSLCAGSLRSKRVCFDRPNIWLRWLVLAALISTRLQRTMTVVSAASAKSCTGPVFLGASFLYCSPFPPQIVVSYTACVQSLLKRAAAYQGSSWEPFNVQYRFTCIIADGEISGKQVSRLVRPTRNIACNVCLSVH